MLVGGITFWVWEEVGLSFAQLSLSFFKFMIYNNDKMIISKRIFCLTNHLKLDGIELDPAHFILHGTRLHFI